MTVSNWNDKNDRIIIKTIITHQQLLPQYAGNVRRNTVQKKVFSCLTQQMLLTPPVNYGLFWEAAIMFLYWEPQHESIGPQAAGIWCPILPERFHWQPCGFPVITNFQILCDRALSPAALPRFPSVTELHWKIWTDRNQIGKKYLTKTASSKLFLFFFFFFYRCDILTSKWCNVFFQNKIIF